MQVTLRQVQIDHGVFQVRVPHEKLDRPQQAAKAIPEYLAATSGDS